MRLADSALQSLANIQHNKFCKGSNLLVLGKLNVDELLEKRKKEMADPASFAASDSSGSGSVLFYVPKRRRSAKD